MNNDLFTKDFKTTPYWWDQLAALPDALSQTELPREADVVVIGSGYTGLHAALQTARGGRSTVVLDAEDVGWGCSTRNGGQISVSIKGNLAALSKKYGAERGAAILREGHNSLAFVGDFVRREKIDCAFEVCGRFHAAHNAAQYEALARSVDNQPKGFEIPTRLVPRAEQHREIDTDAYHGGVVYENFAVLHPGQYHRGLLARVIEAGAQIASRCRVDAIRKDGDRTIVVTQRGNVIARDVVVATNGYTSALTPWLKRRVIPIGSYVIATEEVPETLIDRLLPTRRVITDSRKLVVYYRASPDRRRIVYGGRVSISETDSRVSGPRLHALLAQAFPDFAKVRISHSWMGFIAYTFDELMHVGRHEGIWYSMGYCGSGVGMASYCGMRIGQQVLGLPEGRTAFDGLTFETRPMYTGKPWFLAPSIMYYRMRDRLPM